MKKRISLLLALVMLLTAGIPALAETTLVSWNGLELRLLNYSVSDTDTPMLTLNIRVINNQDIKLWVGFDASTVDGVPVKDTGRSIEPHTDTGSDSPKYYSFSGSDDDGGAGYAAIKSAKTLKTTLIVQDYDSYDELYRQELTIDLASMSRGAAPVETPKPTAAPPASTRTGGNGTAPAYTPASYDFKTLKKGSKGQAVRDLQQRLTDLGYLNDKVDGSFGQNTATAVMSFCAQHGLYINGEATPEMQALLYSSSAQYYVEPWVPLIIGPYYKWDDPMNSSLDNGTFYAQVVNRSGTRTVRGYELYWYLTDVWGNRYVESSTGVELQRQTTFQQTVKPGYIQYTPPITIVPWSWAYTVWVGVHKIVFSDGEIRETDPADIVYFECTIKK